ncbi:hypothetical protein M422DRAFT_218123 [Sphaerobolus stellatus SS14]|nr:hypothetical protein M422DRAFT_218123 [Sphaerobolus stellatus SS14]
MQVVSTAWQSTVHVVTVLFFNPPGLTGWAAWFTIIIRTIVFIVLLRRNLAPFLLYRLSRHIRARSISLRSIRGLYVRRAGRIWRVDRIGWSLHPFSRSRVSVIVEGLRVEILAPKNALGRRGRDSRSKSRGHMIWQALLHFLLNGLYMLAWICGGFYLFPHIQAFCSSVAIGTVQLFVRFVPSIVKDVDFEMDSISLTSQALSGAGIAAKGLKFDVIVDMSQGEASERNRPAAKDTATKVKAASRVRFKPHTERLWEQVWGQAHLSVALNMSVDRIHGFLGSEFSKAPISASERNPQARKNHGEGDPIFHISKGIVASISVEAIPRTQNIKPHSLKTTLTIPDIEIFLDNLHKLPNLHAQPQVSVPDTPIPSSPWSIPSPLSPSIPSPRSPFVNAFSQFAKRRYSVATLGRFPSPIPQESKYKLFISLVGSADLRLSSLRIIHRPSKSESQEDESVYQFGLSRLHVHGGVSNSKDNKLHRNWLGTHELDSPAYQLSCRSQEIRLSFERHRPAGGPSNIFFLLGLDVNTLLHQMPWSASSATLTGDPNRPFIASDVSISKIQFGGAMDALSSLHQAIGTKNTIGIRQPRPLPIFLPRVELNLGCSDISVRLRATSKAVNPTLDLRTAGIGVALHTVFDPTVDADGALRMHGNGSLIMEPVSIRILGDRALQKTRSIEDVVSLIVTETIELKVTTVSNGILDHVGLVAVERQPSAMIISCITDAVAVELWNEELISSTRELLSAWRPETLEGNGGSVKHDTKIGLSIHFAIASLVIVITGKDLNNDCDLDLSRGLQFSTGISIQYQKGRVPCETVDSTSRRQLGISESSVVMDKLGNTMSSDPYVSCLLWHVTCSSTVATPYEYGAQREIGNDRGSILLEVPRVMIRTNTVSTADQVEGVTMKDHHDMTAEIPFIRGRFNLLNLYSLLLAAHTLRSIIPTRPKRSPTKSMVQLTYSLQLHCLHIDCQFPLKERLFLEITSISGKYLPDNGGNVELQSVAAYVPSSQTINLWEELVRLRGMSVNVEERLSQKALHVKAEGLKMAIPYNYVLSDLILDIVLSMKALKHMNNVVRSSCYFPIPSPPPEPPKVLSFDVDISIGIVTLEAADSPFEAKLGLIWKTGGHAQRLRLERELAFEAKLRAITGMVENEDQEDTMPQTDLPYHFTSKRTTSISDARHRLNLVHSMSWISTFSRQREKVGQKEDAIFQHLHTDIAIIEGQFTLPFTIRARDRVPPLFRVIMKRLHLVLCRPSFGNDHAGFLKELGDLPTSTEFSLLVPLYIRFTLDATIIMIRDYPLPMLNVPPHSGGPSLHFETDLVIAEEMGPVDSVQWIQCTIVPENTGIAGSSALKISVPKTVMPVKSYARPHIVFTSKSAVEFTWGVSYHPAIQDIMRIVETLSSPPLDASPSIGFWDKLRLVFHWRIKASFQGGARLHFKGSRDPYHISGEGAGFDFHWDGDVALEVGQPNEERQLIQLTSDTMEISIPDYDLSDEGEIVDIFDSVDTRSSRRGTKKVCARFTNGIRWGMGIVLERTCDISCETCDGDAFNRQCRFFQFVPHYAVKLRCNNNSLDDSYAGFRSNFIHFSTSLTSPLHKERSEYNSFYLTPKTFAHFWSWWHLFDSALSLPIRQGKLFPEARPPTKKFGKHLATIKYRLSFTSLYIAHVYPLDTGDAWEKGETHCVGVKAFLEKFQADMHQREEEWTILSPESGEYKKVKRKPFSAVDVVITGLDLRALFAVFLEPGKMSFPLQDAFPGSRRFWEDLTPLPMSSEWIDPDDFVELDWIPLDGEPNLYMNQAVHCPRFVYFKRASQFDVAVGDGATPHTRSKFGEEDTHVCLMGKEPTAHEIQLAFAIKRLAELREKLKRAEMKQSGKGLSAVTDNGLNETMHEAPEDANLKQMISVLDRYVVHLSRLIASVVSVSEGKPLRDLYDMPVDIAIPEELGSFANVYQVHCPKIHLDNTTRDILQQYYIASRARRGFEYHMSARAVKFIRDQTLAVSQEEPKDTTVKRRARAGSAHAAAQAVRRMITGEERFRGDTITARQSKRRAHPVSENDPLYGWDEGVTEKKSHLCLLLKPQIILRCNKSPRSILVLVADHVILRNYGILDTLNANDPVSGYIMQRNYASVNSLQVFQPTPGASTDHLPFEVFVDVRCETRDFERIVQQTDATLKYDKFNRLRLRNELTTLALTSGRGPDGVLVDHLLHETDLIRVDVPRFSFAADSRAFAAVGDIVSGLLLFSDPAYKARMTQLETMTFSYDFTDLGSAAKVIADLQFRIRRLTRLEETFSFRGDFDEAGQQNMLASKAHIFKLSQELNLIFDAIRLAQESEDERNQEKKSALQVEFSASEISWLILDETRELLAKLAVRGIHFSWLSRKDSSTNSMLSLVDLQAFDGSPDALWPEILAKYNEPPTHRMIKRGRFVEAQWSALAPVGGISIYDYFKVELHPIRLALETRLGNNLADYFIPSRRARREAESISTPFKSSADKEKLSAEESSENAHHQTLQPPRFTLQQPDDNEGISVDTPTLPTHQIPQRPRLVASRSFTNLRSTLSEQRNAEYYAPGLPKSISSTALGETRRTSFDSSESDHDLNTDTQSRSMTAGDASVMRQRSSQKTFVHAEIPSVHVLLSVMKGRGFLVKEARLRTHDLEWHNRTSSLEELISQFIPSDPSLRGWVKVAWQQPIFSVGGVVKELITKTQWGRLGKDADPEDRPTKLRSKPGPGSTVHGSIPAASTSKINITEPSLTDKQDFPKTASDNRDGLERQERIPRQRVRSLFERPKNRSLSRNRVAGIFKRPGSRKSIDSGESSNIPSLPQ